MSRRNAPHVEAQASHLPMPPTIDAFAFCLPVATGRPRFTRRGIPYTPASTKKAAASQAAFFASSTPRKPLLGPIRLVIEYRMPITKTRPIAKPGQPHTRKPDVDNLCKTTMDVLSRLGWWHDDSQVFLLTAWKRHVPEQHEVGVWVRLWEVA